MDDTIGYIQQGTVIKIDGLPFELLGETQVRGTPANLKAARLRHEDLIARWVRRVKASKKKRRAVGGR